MKTIATVNAVGNVLCKSISHTLHDDGLLCIRKGSVV